MLDQKPLPLEAVRTDSSSRDMPVYRRELEVFPRIGEPSRHTIKIVYSQYPMRNGPKILKQDPDKWPDNPTQYECTEASAELVKNSPVIVHSMVSVVEDRDVVLNLEAIFDLKRYNYKLKLLRVTGTVLKFINLLKSKERTEVSKDLNGEELRDAENLWIRSIQTNSFPEEHNQLQKGKTVTYKGQFNCL